MNFYIIKYDFAIWQEIKKFTSIVKNYILACFQHTFLGLITLVTVFIVSHSFAGFIKLLIQFPFFFLAI